MPVTNLNKQQRDWVITKSGYNPSEYSLDDEGFIVSRVTASPPVSMPSNTPTAAIKPSTDGPVNPAPSSSMSPVQAGTTAFLRNAPVAAASGVGAASGLALAGGLGLTGVAAPLGLAVGGATAFGLGTDYVLNKVLDKYYPNEEEKVMQAYREHPTASTIGNILTMPLGGFNPSPSTLARAGGGIAKAVSNPISKMAGGSTIPLLPAEKLAIQNVGIGAGIGAIQPVAHDLVTKGELPAGKDVIMNALLGAVFNKPNAIGKRMGFTDVPSEVTPLPTPDSISGPNPTQPNQREIDFFKAKLEQQQQAAAAAQAQQRPRDVISKKALPQIAEDLQQTMQTGNTPPEARTQPLATTELGKEIMPDYTGVTEQANAEVKAESAADLEARKLEGNKGDRFQLEGERIKIPEEYSLQEWNKQLEPLAGTRGVTVKKGIPVDSKGNQIAGEAYLRNKLREAFVRIHPEKAGWDTLPHELFHVFFDDLRATGDPLVKRAETLVSKSPEFQKLNAEGHAIGLDPEEYLTTRQGMEFVRRQLKLGGKESEFQTWYKDFLSHLKTNFTKKATLNDYTRLFNYKFTYDKPFEASTTGSVIAANGDRRNKNQGQGEVLTPAQAAELHGFSFDGVHDWGEGVGKQMQFTARGFEAGHPLEGATFYMPEGSDAGSVMKRALEVKKQFLSTTKRSQDEPQLSKQSLQEYKKELETNRDQMIDDGTAQREPTEFKRLMQAIKDIDNGKYPNGIRSLMRSLGGRTSNKPASEKAPSLTPTVDKETAAAIDTFSNEGGAIPPADLAYRKFRQPKKNQDIPQVPKTYKEWRKKFDDIQEQENTLANDLLISLRDTSKHTSHERDSKYNSVVFELSNPIGIAHDNIDKMNISLENKIKAKLFDMVARERLRLAKMSFRKIDHKLFDQPNDKPYYGNTGPDLGRNQQEPALPKEGEGKTPYPFKENEVRKGEAFNDSFTSYAKAAPLLSHTTPANEQEAGSFLNPKRNQVKPSINPLRSEVQRIRELPHPDSERVADAFDKYYALKRAHMGKLSNDATGKLLKYVNYKNLKELFTLNNDKLRNVVNYKYDLQDHGSSTIKLSPEEQKISDIIEHNLQTSEAERKRFPALSKNPGIDTAHLPNIISREAMSILMNKAGTPEHAALMKDWFDYYANILHEPIAVANQDLNNLKKSFSNEGQEKNIARSFRPIDTGADKGLPRSWRDDNLIDLMARFNNRYSRRLAYHEAIELNQPVNAALKDPIEGIGGQKNVANILDEVAGVRDFTEDKRTALAGLWRAGQLGPLTGMKDLLSTHTLGAQHETPRQTILSAIDAWKNISDNVAQSFEAGVNRHNISAFEVGEGGVEDMTSLVRRSADVLNIVQGRNFLEQTSRGVAFGKGKFLVLDNIANLRANKLSSQGEKFLKDFVPDYLKYKKQPIPAEVVQEAAAKFTESLQGTYDYRNLPAIAMKGSLAPVFSLARWNVEKLNNFQKYVIAPAAKGNPIPLLTATLGGLVGGEVINQFVQLVTGRKERTPNWKELEQISNDPNGETIPAVTYKLAALASLSGYAGVLGDMTKTVIDKQFKNRPITYENPLLAGVSTAVEDIQFIKDALVKGEYENLPDAISMVLEDYFQAYRLVLGQLSEEKKDQIERGNKFRDLKVYKTTHGEDVGDVTTDRPNPLVDKDLKKFKQTDNLQEAAALLPNLIKKAIEDSKNKDGTVNPDKLRAEFRKLKANSYQTMPIPTKSFASYYNYLKETQGEEKAQQRYIDWALQRDKNASKSELVPTF